MGSLSVNEYTYLLLFVFAPITDLTESIYFFYVSKSIHIRPQFLLKYFYLSNKIKKYLSR